MYSLKITNGCSTAPLQYCADSNLFRSQMAVFIIRAWSRRLWHDAEAFKIYAPPSPTPWFTDFTNTNDPSFPHVQKMWELGITSGCSANPRMFCPGGTLQNHEIAVFTTRARVLADGLCTAPCGNDAFPYTTTPYFSDVPSNDPFFKWIQRFADLGAVSPSSATPGCPAGLFCPYFVQVSRKQMASQTMAGLVSWSYWSSRTGIEMQLDPPWQWKGINYSPRRHTYFRMLYDWYSYDATAGQFVWQMADADLTMLKQNGFNLVHLYLWDRDSFGLYDEPSGFCPYPNHPTSGPGCNASSQWNALADFVQRAESKGIYVALHFVSQKLVNDLGAGVPASISAPAFATWANHFIDLLTPASPTSRRRNVLFWGLAYPVQPPEDTSNNWGITWRDAYKLVDEHAKAGSPNPGLMGIIGTNLGMTFLTHVPGDDQAMTARVGSYQWDWQGAQRVVKSMRTLLSGVYGYAKDPDVYMMQMYHANSTDMQAAISSLVNAPYNPSVALNPQADRIFVVEFATSSSMTYPVALQDEVKGNNIQTWGDANTPTLTPSGQAQWLRSALCAFQSANIQKLGYWALYDPYAMWKNYPFYFSNYDLAWNGYWGLKYEREIDGDKPSWVVLRDFYLNGSLQCSNPRPPSITFKRDNAAAGYYTIGQPVGLIWTAADTSAWAITDIASNVSSYPCKLVTWTGSGPGDPFYSSPNGSCAFAYSPPIYVTGPKTFTFTATPVGGGTPAQTSANVTIGGSPTISAVTDNEYSANIGQYDYLVVWGDGFSRFGGNTLQFVRSGYSDVWMWINDGYFFWERSYNQINAYLAGRLAPGTWSLYVRNGYPSGPAGPFPVTINP